MRFGDQNHRIAPCIPNINVTALSEKKKKKQKQKQKQNKTKKGHINTADSTLDLVRQSFTEQPSLNIFYLLKNKINWTKLNEQPRESMSTTYKLDNILIEF